MPFQQTSAKYLGLLLIKQGQPHAHHLAFDASTLPPKVLTWIHLVALHFSPFVVGQLPCKLL